MQNRRSPRRTMQPVCEALESRELLSAFYDLSLSSHQKAVAMGAIAPVPRISTKSGPFSPGEWLESLPGSARGY